MLVRLGIAALLVVLVIVVLRGTWALHASGMLGSCSVWSTGSDGTQEVRCVKGTLDGHPDLSGKACTLQTLGGSVQFWSCPAPINSAPAGV